MKPINFHWIRAVIAMLCTHFLFIITGCSNSLLPIDNEFTNIYPPITWKGAYEDVDHIKSAVKASAIIVPSVGSSSSIKYTIPDTLVAAAAAHDIVFIGEQHYILEHVLFTTEFVKRLHAAGFRAFVHETDHALGMIFDDYVQLKRDYPRWLPKYGYVDAIREFNQTLTEDERLHFLTFDVNHSNSVYWSVIEDSWLYRDSLLFSELFALPRKCWDKGYPEALEKIASTLEAGEAHYRTSFGDEGYTKLMQLTACEVKSYHRRINRSDMLREDVITENIESVIAQYGKVIVGSGSAHAGKKAVTIVGDNEGSWVGVRLQARYGSRVWSGCFLPVRGYIPIFSSNSPCKDFDAYAESYPSDLMRIVPDLYPNQTVYLPFTGEPFTNKKIGVSNNVYVPAEVFDALVLYPYVTSLKSH
ncbi:MAG: erythromycin esterase family protein [Fibrobacter sp.]|nr:erythromycin esterase family protein [Fibrobacter sp.]